jgi:hypothetical protein
VAADGLNGRGSQLHVFNQSSDWFSDMDGKFKQVKLSLTVHLNQVKPIEE